MTHMYMRLVLRKDILTQVGVVMDGIITVIILVSSLLLPLLLILHVLCQHLRALQSITL
jgi:hypothetical protein